MPERLRRAGVAILLVALSGVVLVGLLTAPRTRPDRAHAIAARLRCPVCQSVSVADSPSETAAGMRTRIRDLIAEGKSDQQIIEYFQARYGPWVLLDPPLAGRTLLLWALPVVALVVGLLVIGGRRRPGRPIQLTPEQRAAVEQALARFRSQDAGS